jgi:hypothetical protein
LYNLLKKKDELLNNFIKILSSYYLDENEDYVISALELFIKDNFFNNSVVIVNKRTDEVIIKNKKNSIKLNIKNLIKIELQKGEKNSNIKTQNFLNKFQKYLFQVKIENQLIIFNHFLKRNRYSLIGEIDTSLEEIKYYTFKIKSTNKKLDKLIKEEFDFIRIKVLKKAFKSYKSPIIFLQINPKPIKKEKDSLYIYYTAMLHSNINYTKILNFILKKFQEANPQYKNLKLKVISYSKNKLYYIANYLIPKALIKTIEVNVKKILNKEAILKIKEEK